MRAPVPLDHAVINTRFAMDDAATRFERLGFQLTPRGYHSLGSINHLMICSSDYLELIGLPADAAEGQPGRPEIAQAPLGINGLVFKTDDVDETYAHLQAVGLAGDPPKAFTRPVDLPDGRRDASFRTVHVRPDAFPGGRVYFCEHGTPELVWRPEWQRHANGADAIVEFVIASRRRDHEAEAFSNLLRADIQHEGAGLMLPLDGARLTLLDPEAYGDRYGDLASAMPDRESIFGALVFHTSDLDGLRDCLAAAGDDAVPARQSDNAIVLREPAFDSVLEFRT